MKATIILALLSSLSAVQATCHSSGDEWGVERGRALGFIDEFCGDGEALKGTYTPGVTKYRCRQLRDNVQAQFWIYYNGGFTSSISEEDCKYRLKNEVNGCPRGGSTWVGDFQFRYSFPLFS